MMSVILKRTIKNEDKTEKLLLYICAPLTVMLVLLAVYGIKGIYPFGKETVDFYDMSQEVVAVYHHIFDYLHGEKIPFIDWYTGLGMNMYNGTSGSNIFDPFNVLLLLFRRNMLLEGMSFLLIIKLMLMSQSFGFFLRKIFANTDSVVKYSLSVGYGLCGFVMMHYTILPWLDSAILFPILMTYVIEILKYGKNVGYTILMTLMLVTNYYLAAMSLVYIFCGIGLFIIVNRLSVNNELNSVKTDIDNTSGSRMLHIFELGVCTVISFALSSFALVPQICQVLSSTRFENNDGYLEALKTVKSPYPAKAWAILGIALPVVFIIRGVYCDLRVNFREKFKENLSKLIWVGGMLVIACLELVVEGTNLLLHFGSYVHYPIRNGFIVYFTIAAAGAYYANKKSNERCKKTAKVISIVALVAALSVSAAFISYYGNHPGIEIGSVIRFTKILGIVYLILFAIIYFAGDLSCRWIAPVVLISQLFIYAVIFIGPASYYADYMSEPEQEAEYIRISNQLVEKMDMNGDLTQRIKNPDTSLNSNYGFVMRRSTLSNMTHLVMKEAQEGAIELGYSIMFTRLLDVGGTELTDAMLGVRNVISRVEQDENIYQKLDTTEVITDHISGEKTPYYYYQRKYTLPFTMIASDEQDLSDMANSADIITFHNQTYQVLSNVDDEAAQNENEFATLLCGAEEGNHNVHVDGRKLLYFWGGCADQEFSNTSIVVNGQKILIPTIKNYNNTCYPSHFNNNTIYIGQYENEDVNIDVVIDHEKEDISYYAGFFMLDVDMLEGLCRALSQSAIDAENKGYITGNTVCCNVKASEGNYLLLPVAYNDGFTTTVNGNVVESINVKGLFTAIRLEPGDNEVKLVYYPEGYNAGTVFSMAGLVIFILFLLIKNKVIKNFEENKVIEKYEMITCILYQILWAAVVVIIYIVPTVANIVFRII